MPDLVELSLAGPRALRAAVDFLTRLDDVEESIAGAAERVQGTLDELLDRVRPIEAELKDLRGAATELEQRLASTQRRVGEIDETVGRLDEKVAQLIDVSARLEGALEHVLDRIPGLSASKAQRRGKVVARAVTSKGDRAA